jgi:hypothetical protein
MSKSNDQDCNAIRDLAIDHLKIVRTKILELQALEGRLAKYVDACSETCCDGPAPQCSILKDIVTPEGTSEKSRGCCG